jgi:hypothetical protein
MTWKAEIELVGVKNLAELLAELFP